MRPTRTKGVHDRTRSTRLFEELFGLKTHAVANTGSVARYPGNEALSDKIKKEITIAARPIDGSQLSQLGFQPFRVDDVAIIAPANNSHARAGRRKKAQ